MRHIYTLIAAMYVVPVSWLLLAFGQDRSAQVFADAQTGGAFDTGDFVPPATCLAGAGLLLGLFATLRFSPLGVVLVGGGYATSYLGLLFDADGMLGLFPQQLSVAGRSIDPTAPASARRIREPFGLWAKLPSAARTHTAFGSYRTPSPSVSVFS